LTFKTLIVCYELCNVLGLKPEIILTLRIETLIARHQWFMPAILATWEAQIRRIIV
jgi:hypothetical protein